MKSETLIGFLLILASTICQAQNNSKSEPINALKRKPIYFYKPELQVDSSFIEKVIKGLFDQHEKIYHIEFTYPPSRSSSNSIHIYFERKDSLNYKLELCVDSEVNVKSIGYFEQNNLWFWFVGNPPPNIILGKTKVRKLFVTPDIIYVYDPLYFNFIYNLETGILEATEED